MKLYEKLEDYMKDSEIKDFEISAHKKAKSDIHSRTVSSKFRSNEPSKLGKSKMRRSEFSSPDHIFNPKISSSVIQNFDFNF